MTTFLQWINDTFNCEICGKTYHIGSFGTNSIVCPQCYKGGTNVIFFDETYWAKQTSKELTKQKQRAYPEKKKI